MRLINMLLLQPTSHKQKLIIEKLGKVNSKFTVEGMRFSLITHAAVL